MGSSPRPPAALPLVIAAMSLLIAAAACVPSDAAEPGVETADPTPDGGAAATGARLRLDACRIDGMDVDARCGTHEVWENRETRSGRKISLNIVVLPARSGNGEAGPIFYLAGGPGAPATGSARGLARSWMREHHDVVLVDQRGTGASNPLDCGVWSDGAGLQGYLEGGFDDADAFGRCAEQLGGHADLRWYATSTAMDDLDEVRDALGYEQINLSGGSYGSRAVLVYLRRHPERARAAVVSGVAPIAFTNPLYHSAEAQAALDTAFAECGADAACNAAFPDLPNKFAELMAALEAEPVSVEVSLDEGGPTTEVLLDAEGFAEGLRVFMYYMPRARRVPLLVHRAWQGDLRPVAEAAIRSNRGIRNILHAGMLLSVICGEDVPRIDPDDIETATAGTFLGDHRVRSQMAVCAQWPRAFVPEDFGDPVSVDVPVLLFSGTMDPVTGPRWGEEAARHLPDSLHLVVPGAHGVAGPCTNAISQEFLRAGTLEGLDTSCTGEIELEPFDLSG